MKSSSQLIAEQVFSVNAYYTKKQNQTKELFFRCLEENRGLEYFSNELSKIWDNIDHKFMDKQIYKLKQLVHSNNVEQFLDLGRFSENEKNAIYEEITSWIVDDEYFKLTPEEQFTKFEQRFKANVEKVFKNSKKVINSSNKESYLEKKIDTYDKQVNQVITYFSSSGEPARQVQLSSYLSMIHNTNLTRSGWNQTMGDSNKLSQNLFIIPYHSFSCPHCLAYQNKILTANDVINIIGTEPEEQSGDILHPNCKCTLSIYWDRSQISKSMITEEEAEELYMLRQKVNTLTLEKSNLRTDMKIALELGDQAKADRCRQRINAINGTIRDIKADLPSVELQTQITAINR